MSDSEVKVTDLSFWLKVLEEKRNSGELHCPATAFITLDMLTPNSLMLGMLGKKFNKPHFKKFSYISQKIIFDLLCKLSP